MLRKAIIFILFIIVQNQNQDKEGIIRIPLNNDTQQDIQTKHGLIKYWFYFSQEEGHNYPLLLSEYIIKNMKNLYLYDQKMKYIYILGKNKNIAKLSFDTDIAAELDIHNKILCELFYQTKYIDKNILSIGRNEEGKLFKFFGGTPLNLISNLNKYTFKFKENISEVELYFNWKKSNKRYNIKLNSTLNNIIEFKDDSHLICLSHDIFSVFQNLLFYKYLKCEYNYDSNFNKYQMFDISDIDVKFFPEINFKIGNKIITFDKNNLILQDRLVIVKGIKNIKEENHNYLFIKNSPCDKNIFGLTFLEKINIREYNLETEELNIYLKKDKNLIKNENDIKLKLNSYNNISILIIFFIILATVIMLFINNSKYKNIEYFNNYYVI